LQTKSAESEKFMMNNSAFNPIYSQLQNNLRWLVLRDIESKYNYAEFFFLLMVIYIVGLFLVAWYFQVVEFVLVMPVMVFCFSFALMIDWAHQLKRMLNRWE
jgi:hypothetical protein